MGLGASDVGDFVTVGRTLLLRDPSLFGIFGGRIKSFGLGDFLPSEKYPSPSSVSGSSSVLSRMYEEGTKPSVSFRVPSHQSLLNRL